MATWNAFFVRKVTDGAISAIRAMFSSAEIATSPEFIRVTLDRYAKIPEQVLEELSSRFETEVMWLSYQSVVDAFEYYHWQAGKLLRALVYGHYMERIWERVDGQAEAWERPFFFNLEDLVLLLEDDEDEDKLSNEEKQQLEQFWQTGELVPGRAEPYLSAQSCAFHIATYYQFPGWET